MFAWALFDCVHQLAAGRENLVRVAKHELTSVGEDQNPAAATEELLTERFYEQMQVCAD